MSFQKAADLASKAATNAKQGDTATAIQQLAEAVALIANNLTYQEELVTRGFREITETLRVMKR